MGLDAGEHMPDVYEPQLKRASDKDIRPGEKPSEWIKRIKKQSNGKR